tara:strand:+ start:125 stop:361 length:237 start_codon:yes stop_codon:yes gene_type:complete
MDNNDMSLPDGFLDELRVRTSIAQVVGRKVTWDQKKQMLIKVIIGHPVLFIKKKPHLFMWMTKKVSITVLDAKQRATQ